ncbi:MAG: zinc-dependent peptidase [bacterium]|nr:MAG: zinc-dependent peptidase [bacterium]
MFRWLLERRRRRLTREPFPDSWEEILHRNVAHFGLLEDARKARLRALIQVFVAECNWEGAGGLEVTDEVRVTISAQACMLLLGLSIDHYRNVGSVVVYPSTVVSTPHSPGFFETPLEPVEEEVPIDGEAHPQGPVVIIWDAALESGRNPGSGFNIVYHEFAHKLDMLDGLADGTPPMRDRTQHREWVKVCSREYLRLKKAAGAGRRTFLDAYGAEDEAEFFAVATEQFFDSPHLMVRHAPDLYRVLRDFYRQDPAGHVPGGERGREIPGVRRRRRKPAGGP